MARFITASALGIFLLEIATTANASSFTMLHNFCSQNNCADGSFPIAGLMRDAGGTLYGTAETGGAADDGVVFALKPKKSGWDYQVLHDFCFSCGDGDFPAAAPIVDIDGNLYGTTLGGGAHDCGIAFKLSPPKWKLTVLHAFCASQIDGEQPASGLSYFGQSSGAPYDGVSPLYGTTRSGGKHGGGSAYALEPKDGRWRETILYNFCAKAPACADGEQPSGPLLVDGGGNLFGNAGGGTGGGVTFQLSPAGSRKPMKETVLYSFCAIDGCPDGAEPSGALVMDAQGAILGTTEDGTGETETIFKLRPDGKNWRASVLHTFCAPQNCIDGYLPNGGLTMDASGAVYGVTELGGTGENGIGGGAAFRLKGKKFSVLYEFCTLQNCADGRVPVGGMVPAPDGNLFGVASQGGPTSSAGVVYQLAP